MFYQRDPAFVQSQPDLCWSFGVAVDLKAKKSPTTRKRQCVSVSFRGHEQNFGQRGALLSHYMRGLSNPFDAISLIVSQAESGKFGNASGNIIANFLGLEWSHLCGTDDCCNPDHGRFETPALNVSRQRCHKGLHCLGHTQFGGPACMIEARRMMGKNLSETAEMLKQDISLRESRAKALTKMAKEENRPSY